MGISVLSQCEDWDQILTDSSLTSVVKAGREESTRELKPLRSCSHQPPPPCPSDKQVPPQQSHLALTCTGEKGVQETSPGPDEERLPEPPPHPGDALSSLQQASQRMRRQVERGGWPPGAERQAEAGSNAHALPTLRGQSLERQPGLDFHSPLLAA